MPFVHLLGILCSSPVVYKDSTLQTILGSHINLVKAMPPRGFLDVYIFCCPSVSRSSAGVHHVEIVSNLQRKRTVGTCQLLLEGSSVVALRARMARVRELYFLMIVLKMSFRSKLAILMSREERRNSPLYLVGSLKSQFEHLIHSL